MRRAFLSCGGRGLGIKFSGFLLITTFILLSIFSVVETISLKIRKGPLSKRAKCSVPVSVLGSKTSRLLMLSNDICKGRGYFNMNF